MSIYEYLKQLLSPLTDSTVIEAGAHIGTDTRRITELLKAPYTYYAFEPDPRNLPALVKVARPLGVSVLEFALADVDGVVTFYQSHGYQPGKARQFTDGSSLKAPRDNIKLRPWMSFTETQVTARRLDTVCKILSIDAVDFMWMDVQGGELEVINGGLQTLRRTHWLYTECQTGRYEGQPGLDGILEALPGKWAMKWWSKSDVLLENERC
jgi:FkbM family methyltransferase